MKLATFRHAGTRAVGIVDPAAGRVWPLAGIDDMLDLIRRYDELKRPLEAGARTGRGIPLAEVRLEAPIPRPHRNVMCVAKNYHDHVREFGRSGYDSSAGKDPDAVPTVPIIFTKASDSVIADGEAIRYPEGVSDRVDYEAELGVVIGTGGRGIRREEAYAHVFGYTIINDMTARDWQGRHKQWFLGKSFDTFCPMGPYLVTADEIDPENLDLRCWVNGELRQEANTRDLIFDIPTLIETISAGVSLYPGDVIATGTPSGVGIGFDPPRFLQRGDVVKIEISGIGTLTNPVA